MAKEFILRVEQALEVAKLEKAINHKQAKEYAHVITKLEEALMWHKAAWLRKWNDEDGEEE